MSVGASEYERIERVAAALRPRLGAPPSIGMILGSGLGSLAARIGPAAGLVSAVSIPYAEIDGFPVSTVVGHAGRLVAGTLAGRRVAALAGRVHLYEGKEPRAVTFPVRVLRALGVETLIVTNAAGGLRADWAAGTFMVMSDHLNLQGVNPLVGENDERLGPRFPDLSAAYDPELRARAREVGRRLGLPVVEGVYAALLGPTYETPAEVRMLRTLGADAVGMSTVPEVIVARHGGMRVLGISLIANAAAGLSPTPLTHEEVTAAAAQARPGFERLLTEVVATL